MSLPLVTVWAERDSPRLRYVLDWLLRERLGLEWRLVHDKAEALASPSCVSYGWLDDVPSIHAGGLLWEKGIAPQPVSAREWQGMYTLFPNEESACDIRFDLFAGIFYLLSRYEEYLPFRADRHGRYPAQESVLFPVLERPVVDEWVEAFRLFLEEAWQTKIPAGKFSCLASYDIDIAWSYLHKGWLRSLGAGLGDIAGRRWGRFSQRLRVLSRQEADPYNSFAWLAAQHLHYDITPAWFFLVARRPSAFDKNISPEHPRMASLIKAFSENAVAGLHPSYYSDRQPARLSWEKSVLESILGRQVSISRQHYIRLRFPQTYHALLAAGIEADYSMGYSTHFGFRAGTGSPFSWYDLSTETATPLRVHPFAFMDTTGRYDMGLSAGASFQRLYSMAEKLLAANSRLVTIFHNFSLGADPHWIGWRAEYEAFLNRVSQLKAWRED